MEMHLVHELGAVEDRDGNVYDARVVGGPAKDGLWDGAIELRDAHGRVLVTPVETRQPNLADLVYWSTGLSPVYIEGALSRALAARAAVEAEALGEVRAVEVMERRRRFRSPVRRAAPPVRASTGPARPPPRTRRSRGSKTARARPR
jgi:hypothetical protein